MILLSVQMPPSDERGGVEASVYCIPWVEACGLVTLCSCRSVTRRFSLVLLKEVRSLHEALVGEASRVGVAEYTVTHALICTCMFHCR